MAALQDKLLCENRSSSTPWTIKDEHFKRALEKISPSVSDKVWPILIRFCQRAVQNTIFLIQNIFFCGAANTILPSPV